MLSNAPVSPLPSTSEGGGGGGEASLTMTHPTARSEQVNFKEALMDDPIVGVETVQHDEKYSTAIPAQPIRSPPEMTPAEKERHDLTHQPPHPGCVICRSTRTPNVQHTRTTEHQRTIPLVVGDYCFLRSAGEKTLLTCLVSKFYPCHIVLAFGVPKKAWTL